jgi:DNA-binding transcriptional ArsR family regulator
MPLPRQKMTESMLEDVAERFQALSEPSRLKLMHLLCGGEMCVSELVEGTGLSHANVSKHLSLLHKAGFVRRRKEGLNVFYRHSDNDVLALCELMCGRLERDAKEKMNTVHQDQP